MGKKLTYGAAGRGDTLAFEPEKLKVITDKKHPLYDPRVERAPTEAMILSIMRLGVKVPLIISRDGATSTWRTGERSEQIRCGATASLFRQLAPNE